MHVDWNWIKQRPHFMAEGLAEHFQVDVAYLRAYRRGNLTDNARDPRIAYRTLLRLPSQLTDLPGVASLDRAWLRQQLPEMLRQRSYDFVWMGWPTFLPAVEGDLGRARLVYDCMDDCGEIAHTEKNRAFALKCERRLLRQAEFVFVSSARLSKLVVDRGRPSEPLIINNGLPEHLLTARPPARIRAAGEPFRLFYFGTLSHWFDRDSVLAALERFPEVVLRLAGPILAPPPRHPRIEHVGIVPHHALMDVARDCDVLVMPFVVNDLIRAVDPVKLYEYIAFGRNIVVSDYPEIRKFGPFVQTYSSSEELVNVIGRLLQDNTLRYSPEQARSFLANQSWAVRVAKVYEALSGGGRGAAP
jgi:glycosyltransferase involved in cell wall biosynthesis